MLKKVTKKSGNGFNRRDHLANERTFLAWIRTNLGIMAFGFVVEKFSFFIHEIAAFFSNQPGLSEPRPTSPIIQDYSSIFGITLVGAGAILCIFAFLRFKRTERQINNDTYQYSSSLDALLALLVFFTGVFLMIYLINSNATTLQK